jgi:hypothetical protein
MKGSEGIPALKLVTLNKLISKMDKAPNLFFNSLFPSVQYPSDEIKWEIEYSSAGMTPFVAPGSVAPAIGLDGVGEGSAKAAYYKEKMYFDEEMLNNLREVGSWATYQTAERKLVKGAKKLDYRIQRRREWMNAKMMIDGEISYIQKGGANFSLSYGIPTSHIVTLTTDYKWGTGASRNPVKDIFDGKAVMSVDAGVVPEYSMCNTETMKLLLFDSDIQDLLSKSAFGDGDLFSNPTGVIASILGIGTLKIYDELYEVPAWLTANVTGGDTTVISVDDASDFEVGGTLRFYDMSEYNTYEDETITAVDVTAGTVTVSIAPAMSFIAGQDKVTMKKKYIADNVFFMFNTMQDGEKIAEFMEAPYGIPRRWGKYGDTKDEWDPEGMWLRIQDKGLPVLYRPETTYKLIVA